MANENGAFYAYDPETDEPVDKPIPLYDFLIYPDGTFSIADSQFRFDYDADNDRLVIRDEANNTEAYLARGASGNILGGGGGAFEDTDGDGVAELQTADGASFEGKRPRSLGAITEAEVVTSDSGTSYTIDLTQGGVHKVTLTADCTFDFAGATTGSTDSVTLLVQQDSTGGRAITWPTGVLWDSGTEPSLTTNAGDEHLLTFVNLDGNWYGFVGGEELA